MNLALAQSLPLIAGAAYAASALWGKQAAMGGGGIWRVTFLTNWGQALLLLPFVFQGEAALQFSDWVHVAITSFAFFVGQVVVFAGLRYGDVSVLTPVMGVKVLVVAAMAVGIAHEDLPTRWWGAAVIAAIAAVVMGGGRVADRKRIWAAIIGGLGASIAFSAVDVCFQFWGGSTGVWRFTGLVLLAMGGWSLFLLPFLEGPFWRMPVQVWRAFLPSLAMTLVQVLLMAYCVVVLKGAAWANLLYSSRGVWSVLFVWLMGPMFGNAERDTGEGVMLRRLFGATMLLGAIALVLV